MRQIESCGQTLHVARFARSLAAQAVIDGDGYQPRAGANARRQRAASHISATESGPPETASTIAGAAFQSANRRFAPVPRLAELSSSGIAAASKPIKRAALQAEVDRRFDSAIAL